MSKKRVLVVDDEMDMRIFISTVFETNGYEALSARDGKEGLKKAIEKKPDLIILDIMMPGEGGVLMFRHLKEDENLKDIPVVILSGVGKDTFYHYINMSRIKPENAISEPEAYIEKPPEPENLLNTAKSILSKS